MWKYSNLLTNSRSFVRTAQALAVCVGLAFMLTACKSSQRATDENGQAVTSSTVFSAPEYMKTVQRNHSQEENLTAKISCELQMDGKTMSTRGTLRMRRDDVVQVSLVDPFVGVAEIVRMEFAKERVLIIDRINKQYIDVPYAEVPFLQKAKVDFNTLQSLFWNQVFEPGKSEPTVSAFSFSDDNGGKAQTTGIVNIDYKDKLLAYRFMTIQPTGTLGKTTISSAKNDAAQFSFDYAGFDKFEGKQFPHEMVMSFELGEKTAALVFHLSSLRNNSDWVTRTPVPKKYTKADPEKIFRSMMK